MMDRPQTEQSVRFDDGRGLYPDKVSAPAPIGMRDSIRRAANLRGMTAAAFIRETLQERLSEVAGTFQSMGG